MPIELDSQKAKATFIKWSKSHPVLVNFRFLKVYIKIQAIGTDKGALVFYNKKNQKKIPTMGKHTKKVVTGDWNSEGLLSKF